MISVMIVGWCWCTATGRNPELEIVEWDVWLLDASIVPSSTVQILEGFVIYPETTADLPSYLDFNIHEIHLSEFLYQTSLV